MEEPLANSTLLGPIEESAEPALAVEAESEAGKEGSTSSVPQVDPSVRKRIKRRLAKQRKALNKSLSKLSTDPNGQGSQETEAEPSTNQPSGYVEPPNAKREKNSPGETSEPKRPRREESHPVKLSFAEATRRDIFVNIVPLDSEGNEIGATAGDKQFITVKLEQFITSSNPNINITDFTLRGNKLRLKCLNQKTLESVKSVVCPLKGPRGNLQGYQCLGPGDRPPLVTYGVWVEKPVPIRSNLLALFQDANNWMNPKKMVVKAAISKEKGTTFLIGVEPEIRMELLRRNFQIRFGVGRTAYFKSKSKDQRTRAS